MIVGVVKETYPGERRVAIVPAVVPSLTKSGLEVLVQSGAGKSAGFNDSDYTSKGATIAVDRAEVFRRAEVMCQVRIFSANPDAGKSDLPMIRREMTMIGLAGPLDAAGAVAELASTGARCFGLELLPRIARAQAMDVLSSQATVAGYKAVLLAASASPRMFPMMMTAAGTISAAKVFVIGAGVAGLQAIAFSRRFGAVVVAYDVRPVVKEQVQSLGAKFLELELSGALAEGQGGYAKQMDEGFYRKQRELMAATVAQSDVIITTAAVPGAKAPVLITADMVKAMPAGGVIVDLASRPGHIGGNCEITQPDQTIVEGSVTIHGPTNLSASVPQTASQLFAKNMATFVLNLVKDGQLRVDLSDEIIAQTLLTQDGIVVNDRVKLLLGATK